MEQHVELCDGWLLSATCPHAPDNTHTLDPTDYTGNISIDNPHPVPICHWCHEPIFTVVRTEHELYQHWVDSVSLFTLTPYVISEEPW